MQLAGPALEFRTSPRRAPAPVLARTRRLDPRRFGRAGVARSPEPPARASAAAPASAGIRLFAMTFLAGFLFVSILLA